jgi:large subunit ribosomal protein L9
MDVILLERVERLGQIGDVVKVKPGFARNFLLPEGKALRATESNRKHFDARRSQIEAENLSKRQDAEAIGKKLAGIAVTIICQAGETGQLYGSVTARTVSDAVTEAGFSVNRTQIRLDRPIKVLGLHPVKVLLHPEVTVEVTANVAKSVEEAKVQLERGAAVTEADIRAAEDAAAAARAAAEAVLAEVSEEAPAKEAGEEAPAPSAKEKRKARKAKAEAKSGGKDAEEE